MGMLSFFSPNTRFGLFKRAFFSSVIALLMAMIAIKRANIRPLDETNGENSRILMP